ncbi:Calx-beta domain-containing protein [uncultured Draconibacterium sp.]|uniref:Calx-beta domain-containing protein n=1 Tax=uncultured Draconibacterium sp. TaxID=1573823 RepID=UPI0032602737
MTDNDTAVVSINSPTAVTEGNNVVFTVSVDKAVQGGFTVNYQSNDGTATVAGSDYTDQDRS